MNIKAISAAAAAAALTGCFTVHHSEYPAVEMTAAPAGNAVAVAVSGFEATLTGYVPVTTYQTVWHHGGPHHFGPHAETYQSTTYYPQATETTMFVDRAANILEEAGFKVASAGAKYRVEVKFTGPVVTDDDRTATALWLLCSALSADYAAQTWSAKLKIYDAATNDLLMHHDYTEKTSAAVWGPIPIFSPACSDQTEHNTLLCWSLNALTDRALADATAFLASRK